MKMEQTQCSETLVFKLQTPVNHPEETIHHSGKGQILKSRTASLLGVTYGAWQKVNISGVFFEHGRWQLNKQRGGVHSAWLNTHQSTTVYQNLFEVMYNESQIADITAERYNEVTQDKKTRRISSIGIDVLMTSVHNTSHYADITGDMAFLSSEILSFRSCHNVCTTLIFI
jgi:hypothetical protein